MSTSIIIRLYRRHKRDHAELVGVVESISSEKQFPFHNKDELWQLLQRLSQEDEELKEVEL